MLTAAGSYTKTFQTIHGCDSVIALTLTVDPTYLQKIAAEHKFSNITMFEKTIRAFSLLESLALSGCPFVFKGNKMCSLEIVKQLYDIASLFDNTTDLTVTKDTFRKFATIELAYRNLKDNDILQVLGDIYQTSLCICLQGKIDNEHFKLLQDGIKRIQSFVHSERYYLDLAIIDASKTAYLSTLISNNLTKIEHFDKNNIQELQKITIENPLPTKLNKLKKSNIEAFFYWYKIYEIMKDGQNFCAK